MNVGFGCRVVLPSFNDWISSDVDLLDLAYLVLLVKRTLKQQPRALKFSWRLCSQGYYSANTVAN